MLRILLSAVLVAGVALTMGCAAPQQGPSADEMIAGAKALDQTFLDAFNRGDGEAVAACYWNSPETVTFPPDMLEARGADGIRQGYEQMFTSIPGAKLELTESHEIPAGDMVIGWGLWHMTMTGPDGEPVEMTGRYTDVKAEKDGKWVYVVDHASVPLPPPPDDAK